MSKKKPVANEKTISGKIDRNESKKPLPIKENSESSENLESSKVSNDTPPLPASDAAALPDTTNTIEDDRPVSLSQVMQLKKSGNYEVLEYHMRRGALEMLPTEDVERLLQISQEHAFLCDNARRLLAALKPLLDKEAELSTYLDLESKLKIDFAKIMEEVAMVMMNPDHKTGLPFWNLLVSCFDSTQFKGMSLQPLQSILAHQGFELKPYQDFASKLGLIPTETNTQELTQNTK